MKKNNFEEFGFTADFEGEILKEVNIFKVGYYLDEYKIIVPCRWDKNGKCLENKNYSLTSMNKPWYKNQENFESYKNKLIISKFGDVRKIQNIDKNKVSTAQQNMYHDILDAEDWKLLTKEEALELVIEE